MLSGADEYRSTGGDAGMATLWHDLERFDIGRRLAYGGALAAVFLLTLLIVPLRDVFGGPTLSLLYVLLLFGIGVAVGTGPAVASAVLAFLLSDLLLYEPYLTLVVSKRHHLLGLLIFLAIALGTGVLASHLRASADEMRREAARTVMLYDLNRALISDVTLEQVLASIVRGVVDIYGARGSRLLVRRETDPDAFRVAAAWPAGQPDRDDRRVLDMARRALDTGAMAGISHRGRRIRLPHGVRQAPRDLTAGPEDDVLYVPVGASDERVGVLEVTGRPGGGRFLLEDARMLKSFADQAALAVQRASLIEQATRTAALEQSSELKSALLAAVSHDLRTPLAAIKMSASALRSDQGSWDGAARAELLAAIEESTDWLTRVVDNLLDLSRIEGGALRPDRDWIDLADLIQHVLMQMERQLAGRAVTLAIDPGVPLAWLDYVQISQVVMNVLANAVKYSPPGSPIEIAVESLDAGERFEIRVTDHGRGIPRDRLPLVFVPFYRGQPGDEVEGYGVGLSICQGLVRAHGGTIAIESGPGVGATVRIRLPVDADHAGEEVA
jgi:two-component system sensor histidine kinase KdpD